MESVKQIAAGMELALDASMCVIHSEQKPRMGVPFNADALQGFEGVLDEGGSIKSVTTTDSLLGIGESATITLTMSHLSNALTNGKIQVSNGIRRHGWLGLHLAIQSTG